MTIFYYSISLGLKHDQGNTTTVMNWSEGSTYRYTCRHGAKYICKDLSKVHVLLKNVSTCTSASSNNEDVL